MKKTSASIFLALFLDLIFGLLFMFLIISVQKEKEVITYYMNQIGIYKEEENAYKCIEDLSKINLVGYTYSKEDLFIVVTSIYLNKDKCIEEQDILNKQNIKFILKEITTSNERVINALRNNNFNEVMELMTK